MMTDSAINKINYSFGNHKSYIVEMKTIKQYIN